MNEVKNIVFKYTVDASGMEVGKKAISEQTQKEQDLLEKINKVNAAIDKQAKEFQQSSQKAAKATQAVNDSVGKLDGMLNNLAGGMAAYFTVDAIIGFGKAVIGATAEFQKMEAVLTNTLGSKGAAARAMKEIQDFAAKTPYSVSEATTAFIKLQNSGLNPTMTTMQAFADIAANAGKGMDQMAEAVNDASRGEFERLKEFFIDASVRGDKVAFTFKNVTTEVDNNAGAIRDYLVSLGQVEGVMGATAAISETLGGKINNLGDSWNRFLTTLGSQSSGIFTSAIADMDGFLKTVTKGVAALDIMMDEKVPIWTKMEMMFKKDGISEAIRIWRTLPEEGEKAAENWSAAWDSVAPPESRIERLKRFIKEATDELNSLPVGTPDSAFNTLTREIEKWQKELDKLLGKGTKGGISKEVKLKLKFTPPTQTEVETAVKSTYDFQLDALQKQHQREQLQIIKSGMEKGQAVDVINKQIADKQFQHYADLIALAKQFGVDTTAAERQLAEAQLKIMGEVSDARKEQAEKDKEREKALVETYKQQWIEAGQVVADIINQGFDMRQSRYQAEIEALQAQKEQELAITGDNTRARAEVEEQYQARIRQIRQKQAEAEKKQASFNILLFTAQAIARTLAEVPKQDFGISTAILIGLYTALGAAQLAAVQKAPIPKYAKGVEKVPGRGTDTSDNVPALLSPGERVITAKKNREFYPILSAIHNGKISTDINKLVDMPMHEVRLPNGNTVMLGTDNADLLAELKGLNKALSGLPIHQTYFDERGVTRFVRTDNANVERRNRRHL